MANDMSKVKTDIDRHSPRLMPDNCQQLDPSYFSLPTTFKGMDELLKGLAFSLVWTNKVVVPEISESLIPVPLNKISKIANSS
jgi:hypothetical protein